MIEIGVVLALLTLVSLVAFSAFGSTRSGVRSAAAAPLLRSAQLELRRGTTDDGSFAADLVTVLTAAGLSAGAGARSTGSVSVLRVDDGTAALATAAGEDCLVLLDRPAGSSTWALFRSSGPVCDVSVLVTEAAELPTTGSASAPQEVGNGG